MRALAFFVEQHRVLESGTRESAVIKADDERVRPSAVSAGQNVGDMQAAAARALAADPRHRPASAASQARKSMEDAIIAQINGPLDLLDSLDQAMRRIRIQAAGQPRMFLEKLAAPARARSDAGLLRPSRELQEDVDQFAKNLEFLQSLFQASALESSRPSSSRRLFGSADLLLEAAACSSSVSR